MPCTHMKKLYQLVEQYDIKLASSDLVRIVCPHCQLEETCPSRLMDEAVRPEDEIETEITTEAESKSNQADE